MKRSLIYAVIGAGITAALVLGLLVTPLSLNHPPQVTVSRLKQVIAGTNVDISPDAIIDEDGDPLTYNWTQLSGEQVLLFNSNSSKPVFSIAPSTTNRTLTFQLEVSDGKVTRQTMVNVVVVANKPPQADAGLDQSVAKGEKVVLDGSNSTDPENAELTYKWGLVGGSVPELANLTGVKPTFLAPSFPTAKVLTFQLIVNDGIADSKPSTVKLTVEANKPPVADAGPDQSANKGDTVVLSGLGSSDPDKDKLTYEWIQTSGADVELSNSTTARVTFVAPGFPTDRALTFQLTVNDGTADSKPDPVKITVRANKPPVANAGEDKTVAGESQVTLDGTGSTDGDGDKLTYQWKQTAGEDVVLSNTTAARPTFKAPAAEVDKVLTFQLVVNDGTVDSRPATVKITVKALKPPVANAGVDQEVSGDSQVTLDGSKSTSPEGKKLAYMWKQTSGAKVELSNANSTKASFKAPPRGTEDKVLEFQLIVNDGALDSEPDTIQVTVKANRAPVANAGPDQRVNSGDDVVLDGTKSTDADGDELTYEWKRISGPNVTIKYPKANQATFTAPDVGSAQTLKIQLTVSDGKLSKTDIVEITIRPS